MKLAGTFRTLGLGFEMCGLMLESAHSVIFFPT
jgi:hypothetical protein